MTVERVAPDLLSIVDAVDLPIVVLRRDSSIAWFNKAADTLGLSPSDIGRQSRELPVFAAFPRLEDLCGQVVTDGVESHTDFRHGDAWFAVRVLPDVKDDGEVTGCVLSFADVTALRTRVDQAVYERECIKAIVNTVADPLIVLGAGRRIESANRAFYEMFGITRESSDGVSLPALATVAFELTSLSERLEAMLAGHVAFEPFEIDRVRTADGPRALMVDVHKLTLPGNTERTLLVTFHDITARKTAEAAKERQTEMELRRSEAFLAEGQRLSMTGSFIWRLDTDEITFSDELRRIFAFGSDEVPTLDRIVARVHPDDLSVVTERIALARSGVADHDYDVRLRMPDGSLKFLRTYAHAIRHPDGHLELVGAMQDVTQRRMSEEALAKARSELAKVARMESVGVLTAAIAHEINQPLSGIITNASTCLRMLSADPPNVDGARETARRTIRDGNRTADVITRLRTLYGRKQLSRERMDLNEATREVTSLSMGDLHHNRVIVRHELAEDLPSVRADRIQLQQVILNLVRNASEAMSAVDDRVREMLIRTERGEGDQVRLSVSDTGAGLPPGAIDQLFEAFYTTKDDGMGIGLSISRSIIEAHQGRLWGAPNDGPGATFSFAIPCGLDARP